MSSAMMNPTTKTVGAVFGISFFVSLIAIYIGKPKFCCKANTSVTGNNNEDEIHLGKTMTVSLLIALIASGIAYIATSKSASGASPAPASPSSASPAPATSPLPASFGFGSARMSNNFGGMKFGVGCGCGL